MTAAVTASLDDLIEEIATWSVGMPVRAMEQVLAHGASAVPALLEGLDCRPDDPERDRLWLIVLLGELRQASAIEPLIDCLRPTDDESLALAAVEALAKIGLPAVPALLEVARAPDPRHRLCAYAGLGWIPEDRAYGSLVEALGRDPELIDVVAMALGDQGRPEALPALYEAYRTCAPWHRVEVEDVLRDLHAGRRRTPLWTGDWRLRYRRQPALGTFSPSWVWMALLVQREGERRAKRAVIPLRPLEEIVEDSPEPDEPPEVCEECGAGIERPTGMPACPETALDIAMYQLRFLAEAWDDGTDDLFELLDALDAREWEHLDRGEPVTPGAREHWRDERDELRLCRQTCEWLIQHGAEAVSSARALLLAEASRLAERHGGPNGYPHAGAAAHAAWPAGRTERSVPLRLGPEVQALLPRSGPRAAPAGPLARGGLLK
jgi:HEAT repeats